jgi:two-component system, NtrC family, sensor kinase
VTTLRRDRPTDLPGDADRSAITDSDLGFGLVPNRRVLVVDDNEDIHRDFRNVLERRNTADAELALLSEELFGETSDVRSMDFDIDSAYQGQDALVKVRDALAQGRPYALAFVDVRMPPGWDGVKTTAELLKCDPDLGIVICSAYSDHSWEDMAKAFGETDRVLILKKPFDTIEVRQLAQALQRRWQLAKQAALNLRELTAMVDSKTRDLQLANEQLRNEAAVRERMEADLRLAQKLEAVGQLAAGIAHEINTPMQYIADNLTFLRDAWTDFSALLEKYRGLVAAAPASLEPNVADIRAMEQHTDLDHLVQDVPKAFEETFGGVRRVTEIVQSIKEFSHPDLKEKSPTDLNRIIQSTLMIARNEYKYVADVEADLGELPMVTCRAGDIGQVLLNLIVNASHAIADIVKNGERGKIAVTSARDGADAVVITIRDTGSGIPAAIRDRVFDPFFTTKEVGRGTGQGLAIARSVVDKHRGTLSFETAEGKGTTFKIRLPVDAESAPAAA